MKNFKKIITVGICFLLIVIYFIYQHISNKEYNELEYDNFEANQINNEAVLDEDNFIVLHITGAVTNPRNY